MQLCALFRLDFSSASYLRYLTLLHTVTRWPVLQKVRRHTYKVLRPIVGTRFQVLFHSPPGVLFTFPSDRKSTRLNSSHANISYAVFCLKKKKISLFPFYFTLHPFFF